MYVSRLNSQTQPGKTHQVEQELKTLVAIVVKHGALKARVLRAHFASPGAADLVFEQEAPDLASLEMMIKKVTDSQEFQGWTRQVSGMLAQSPKREIYQLVG